ncbi:MAG: ATP-binding protein [Leptospiraceae bacterium]|nr:ATP-binding protein [Leptospiraceae bacterium]MDW7976615.1 ATP-binding protein [Leptospiraceae bacterium]
MYFQNDHTIEELQEQIKKLQREKQELIEELNYIKESPYLQKSISHLSYKAIIDREEVMQNEMGKRINEKYGTMYEIKTQAYRLAHLVGIDPISVRIMVTEAIQNAIEHGYGKYVIVKIDIYNDVINPYISCSFKHEMPEGKTYTLKDIEENALKGDVTSEYFDFESSRGRGEFLMKELTDERRIINGIEINPDGRKVRYFNRILIKYKDPSGPREKVTFSEIKKEIDRLDIDDVVCYFHIHHVGAEPIAVTIATLKSNAQKVAELMREKGYQIIEEEPYYRTVFVTYKKEQKIDRDELLALFQKIRYIVQQEINVKLPLA